jgi:hypothetical protein
LSAVDAARRPAPGSANRIFVMTTSLFGPPDFFPGARIMRKKLGGFSELGHTETMIFATRNM